MCELMSVTIRLLLPVSNQAILTCIAIERLVSRATLRL